MPSLLTRYNFGRSLDQNPDLNRQLDEIYTTTAQVVNTKVSKVVVPDKNPPASSPFNANYELGDIYVRPDTNAAWIMTSRTTAEAVTWTLIS